jgi:cytochrome c biogenesis protein ResB
MIYHDWWFTVGIVCLTVGLVGMALAWRRHVVVKRRNRKLQQRNLRQIIEAYCEDDDPLLRYALRNALEAYRGA